MNQRDDRFQRTKFEMPKFQPLADKPKNIIPIFDINRSDK